MLHKIQQTQSMEQVFPVEVRMCPMISISTEDNNWLCYHVLLTLNKWIHLMKWLFILKQKNQLAEVAKRNKSK